MIRTKQIFPVALVALIISLPCAARPAPGHSSYIHALQDLRLASDLLQRTDAAQPGKDQPDEAILASDSIDAAIAEINGAPLADRTTRNIGARIDPRLSWEARLVRSLELLDKAQRDFDKERDGSDVKDLRTRVSAQIDQARDRIRVAIETVNFNYSESAQIR